MQIIYSTKTGFFDVDCTLVFSQVDIEILNIDASGWEAVIIDGLLWYVHSHHVRLLQEFSARGFTNVVWSAGGAAWAAKVITRLGLEDYVDLVIDKPSFFCDDKAAVEFMPENIRTYIKPS